jgi:hypothetical protein
MYFCVPILFVESFSYSGIHTVTSISIARKRLAKHIPSEANTRLIGRLLLRNGPVNMHS